ncbi:MAG: GNAT family N-acetyltransferase [Acidobacteria bacterium]|nr:MAG: GNAT family N-acetyltransferase [Acidobacteriota bacterium]
MSVEIVEDAIGDPRWSELLDRHPAASIFHSPGWLSALRQTYGYEPFVVTTSPGPVLDNGLVACRVKGWTSRRLVSLPFSDHCDPLVDSADDVSKMLAFLSAHARATDCQSVELRPRNAGHPIEIAARASGLERGAEYHFHRLDLRPSVPEMFGRMHHSSTQRAIRRAEREGLTYETGTSDRLLASFYRLLRMTRRRHGLPPQPLAWFRNLIACLGQGVAVHAAINKDGEAIAAILTLTARKTIYYKYGGSDAAHHRLGGMPFLFWRVIQDARARDLTDMDLGRSDTDQPGLVAFKDHLGATRSTLTYYRSRARSHHAARHDWMSRAARGVCTYLPDAALDLTGRLIYKRLG